MSSQASQATVLVRHWSWRVNGKGDQIWLPRPRSPRWQEKGGDAAGPHATSAPSRASQRPSSYIKPEPPLTDQHPRCSVVPLKGWGQAEWVGLCVLRVLGVPGISLCPLGLSLSQPLPELGVFWIPVSAVASLWTAGAKTAIRRERASLEFNPDGHPDSLAKASGPTQPHLRPPLT